MTLSDEEPSIITSSSRSASGDERIQTPIRGQTTDVYRIILTVSNEHSQPTRRRGSQDINLSNPRQYLVPVEETLRILSEREDSDRNEQITIDDTGPKVLVLTSASGQTKIDIRGTYMLANLYQELTLAQRHGHASIFIRPIELVENPVQRLSRRIEKDFWNNLTRKIDRNNITKVALDQKDWTSNPRPRIYIPRGAPEQYEYYSKLAAEQQDIKLDVQWLPEGEITGEYVRDLNAAPGLLAVKMEKCVDAKTGETDLQALPFVVPGGRFNELYGWDSYMIALGLIESNRVSLAKSMVEHFCFCIQHYGKIFNANRSYYLGRSQPPFLTDMAIRVYNVIKDRDDDALEFLKIAIQAAIKEYHGIWNAQPRLDPETGLSRYRPIGVGVPPETEDSHFEHLLEPYAGKHNLTRAQFVAAYNSGEIKEPALDEYFLHDRAVRESGHDTTYRLEGVAANLATIDLNSLLYKYENDISFVLQKYFKDTMEMPKEWCAKGKTPGYIENSREWEMRAVARKKQIEKYLWNSKKGMYFDYDTVKKEQITYESATTFWALWAGLASDAKAKAMVDKALPKFEALGGLVSGTKESLGEIGLDQPNRQWDYPYGWAPHQILAWEGLIRYGFLDDARRLAYKWLLMMLESFYNYHGVVVEKYNVEIGSHKVDAEYGNQGSDIKGVAMEGFGWVNASYVIGLQLIDSHMTRALGALTEWDTFEKRRN